MKTMIRMAIDISVSDSGETSPPYRVASPIWAGSGCSPTSTASVIPSKVNMAWIPTTIRKYPTAQVIILLERPHMPIRPARIGANTMPRKIISKMNMNGSHKWSMWL